MMKYPIRHNKSFLVFGQPCLGKQDSLAISSCIKSKWIGTGPLVKKFEEMFSKYKRIPYSVAVNSCTAGLHLACVALNLKPGDEVITTAMTFCATVNAIIHSGATPVLADIDPKTMNIDPAQIIRKITRRTKAILVVHFAGRPCDMNEIQWVARKFKLKIIEDCAHAIETEYHGKSAGSFGECGVLSFYPTKNITTGEGGLVVTKSEALAQHIKELSLHGLSADAWKRFSDKGYKHYFVQNLGFKYNMTDIQASLGLEQLKNIEKFQKRRKSLWDKYNELLGNLPLILPAPPEPKTYHARHLYTVLIDPKKTPIRRDEVLRRLTFHRIGVGVHYLSLAEHPFYQKRYGWKPEMWPRAHFVGSHTLSLPLSGCLSSEDLMDVVLALKDALSC